LVGFRSMQTTVGRRCDWLRGDSVALLLASPHGGQWDAGVAEASRPFISGLGQDSVEEPDRGSSLELCSNVGPVAEHGETRDDHEIGRVQVLAV